MTVLTCRPKCGVQYMYETQMDPHQLRQHTLFIQCQVGHPGKAPMMLAANLPLSQACSTMQPMHNPSPTPLTFNLIFVICRPAFGPGEDVESIGPVLHPQITASLPQQIYCSFRSSSNGLNT